MCRFNPPRSKEPKERVLAVGPGSYDPRPLITAQAYSILGRPGVRSAATIVPGPGEYGPEKLMNYIYPPLVKIFKPTSSGLKQGPLADMPGPGAYNPKPIDKIKGPRYNMMKTLRFRIMKETGLALKPPERERRLKMRESSPTPPPEKDEKKHLYKTAS